MALRRPRDASARRGAASDLVIIGLANPGDAYVASRHNVGGAAVELVAKRRGVTLSAESRQRCRTATCVSDIGRVTLAVPTVFMNESGAVLPGLMRRTSLANVAALLIAHDELDLEPGRLQLKRGGGLAGHNGLRSLAAVAETSDFLRLRIGIGKPDQKHQGADWVLHSLTGERRRELEAIVEAAATALECVMDVGFDEAQRRINAAGRD